MMVTQKYPMPTVSFPLDNFRARWPGHPTATESRAAARVTRPAGAARAPPPGSSSVQTEVGFRLPRQGAVQTAQDPMLP